MDFEAIIKKSFDKMNQDIELRNSLYLSILYKNIDSLANNSAKWFGDKVPQEFIKVLNSMINFSMILAERSRIAGEHISERVFVKFNPKEVCEELRYDFNEMLSFRNFIIHNESNIDIVSSRNIFKDSLYHIFFCISQFIISSSYCEINLYKKRSSVVTKICFYELSKSLPDVRKLVRLFFAEDTPKVVEQNEFRIKVGMSIAIENIQRIGGQITVDSFQTNQKLEILITFPSEEFISTISDVRKYDIQEKELSAHGTVSLCLADKIIELLIAETLVKSGYEARIEHKSQIKLQDEEDEAKAYILDYEIAESEFGSMKEVEKLYKDKKVFIIHKKNVIPEPSEVIEFIAIPFAIDRLLEMIE